ncbi:methyltransferase domain-containing protein [Moorena sp. SIO4G3]|uniref:class I SAM-dependent methyltransferase n=1 Tax=Moorena sp. SIO4G3 TaxID=2607821 RepID=UPI00142A72C2|nr:methyltransferase domain-containing protein [Moorena sp. SIO4G3]NEO78332.1 class I SAM-dependent methyltransferase [Moorena sp. SIO4G3]
MATVLRAWSYQYQWLYDSISRIAALSVGGERRFRQLPLQGLTIHSGTKVLDLCCGSGQATQFLVELSEHVTGLDISPLSLERAQRNVPQANYVEGLAEQMPFPEAQFDLVHTSAALHEMTPEVLQQIIQEVHRVLKPGGVFTLVDLHKPTNVLFWPGLAVFMWLFETQTAWQLLETDLVKELEQVGFKVCDRSLHAGGSLQVIQVTKA